MNSPHRIPPKTRADLASLSCNGKDYLADRERAELEFLRLREELIEWQIRLYAEGRRALLVVLQGMDAAGKDGTIRHVFKGVNPQGVTVTSFKEPSKRELAHDFLWRIHQNVPARGMIGVFNRSHYEDVLIVRAEKLAPQEVWSPRYEQINAFEKILADNGTTILKFFLHVSRKEQRERFRKRLEDPRAFWKFCPHDVERSQLWDEYRAAFEDALSRCNSDAAPWYVIPADQKWYRNYSICKTIVETLQEMNPAFPKSPYDPRDFHLD